jgi:hypothetical protein
MISRTTGQARAKRVSLARSQAPAISIVPLSWINCRSLTLPMLEHSIVVRQGLGHMPRSNSIAQSGCELSAPAVIPPGNRCITCITSPPVLGLVIPIGISLQAKPYDRHLGIIEYEISCLSCHDINGRGDVRLPRSLNTALAAVTRIANSNGGEIPFAKVAGSIDGRALVAAHGNPSRQGASLPQSVRAAGRRRRSGLMIRGECMAG